ncbi:MAG: hypothetical protein QRY71_02665 [Candidatus Rhabdochlamydia sp.]
MNLISSLYPSPSTYYPSYQNTSFTECGVLWILSNDTLNPCQYQSRKIINLSSLKESLASTDIDIFDREVNPHFPKSRFLGEMSKVKRALALLSVVTIFAPFGLIWHLGQVIYDQALHTDSHKRSHLMQSLICELKWSLAFLGSAAFMIQLMKIGSIAARIFLSHSIKKIPQNIVACALILGSIWTMSQLTSALVRFLIKNPMSLTLKEKFGIVGENGWLLTSQENKALDHEHLEQACDHMHIQQAVNLLLHFRALFSRVDFRPSDEELITLCNHPQLFLSNLYGSFNHAQQNWAYRQVIDVLDAINSYDLATELTDESIFFEGSSIRNFALFPFSTDACRMYFDRLPEAQNLEERSMILRSFDSLLEILQRTRIEEGTPDHLQRMQRQVFDVNTPYEALGCARTAEVKEYKKAYTERISYVNPEMATDEWKPLSLSLFLLFDSAYRYCIYTASFNSSAPSDSEE